MSKNSDDEKTKWDQVMENFDLLYSRMNDIGQIQQELKKEFQEHKTEQKLISQQVLANGQAVASLTLRQMEVEAQSEHSESLSMLSEEDPNYNIFAKPTRDPAPATSKQPRHNHDHNRRDTLPHHALPKMQFAKFDGSQPRIWFDKCENYFTIYDIPEHLKVTAAVMHLEGNAAKWWQAYKQNHKPPSWPAFCVLLQNKFGADDFRSAITDLLALKQTGTVEDYTIAFQALQYDISMHNSNYDELFLLPSMLMG
jgi:hypothetical protein